MAEPDDTVVDDDYRTRLVRLRDQLTTAIETCSENMLPQLSGQLRATLADIDALPPLVAGPKTLRDQLKEQRDKRAENRGPAPAPAATASSKGGKRGA